MRKLSKEQLAERDALAARLEADAVALEAASRRDDDALRDRVHFGHGIVGHGIVSGRFSSSGPAKRYGVPWQDAWAEKRPAVPNPPDFPDPEIVVFDSISPVPLPAGGLIGVLTPPEETK